MGSPVHMIEVVCLDAGIPSIRCSGEVEFHSLDGIKWWARCSHHWEERVQRFEGSIEREALSPSPPEWFDPTYAGEVWEMDPE